MKFTMLKTYKIRGDFYCRIHDMPIMSFEVKSLTAARRIVEKQFNLSTDGWYIQRKHSAGLEIVKAKDVHLALIEYQAKHLQEVEI
jgi:hypothetical protein